MEKNNVNHSDLISFLRNLANSIENGSEPQEKIQKTGEFYISYKALESNQVYEESDFIKFFIMGWYVYSILSNGIESVDNLDMKHDTKYTENEKAPDHILELD